MDLATRIVAFAARLLPAERQEWRAAMIAELRHVRGAASRLRFSLGCLRASLFAPRESSLTAGAATSSLILLGVAACIATTAYTIARYPIATANLTPVRLISFALALAGYCWIALLPPRALVVSRSALRVGVVGGLTLYFVMSVVDRIVLALVPPQDFEQTADPLLLLSVLGMFVAGSAIVASRERSFRSGLAVAAWAGSVNALLGFSIDMLATVQGWNLQVHVRQAAGQLPDLSHFLSKHLAEHLSTAMRNLAWFPMLALFLGAIGAALGVAGRALSRRIAVLVR